MASTSATTAPKSSPSSPPSDMETCTFDLDEIKEYVDLSSFRFMLVTITGTKIAIATTRYLVIMEEVLFGTSANQHQEKDKIQTVVEFGEISGRPTAIQWLNQSVLCVGFETGALTCFNDFGETMSEHEFSTSPLMAIHVLPSIDPATNTQHIWALYENGFLISVPMNHLLGGTSLARYYLKYKLVDHGLVNDFAVLSSPYISSIFESDSTHGPLTSFVVSGIEPALSLYTVGGKQHFQHFGKLASYVRDKVHSAITKTVGSALVSFFGSNGNGNDPIEEGEDYTPISSILDFNESDKRRILRLSLSPGGKLIAAADSLGRVLLFDSRLATTAVRIWKGVREARFAWTEDRQQLPQFSDSDSASGPRSSSGVRSKRVLSLAIYAPQTGLLSLWALRHGPCLRSIPVGQQCHIFTVYDYVPHEKEIQSRCALLRPDNSNKLQLSIVSPFGYSDEDIDLSMIDVEENPPAADLQSDLLHLPHQKRGSFSSSSQQTSPALDEMRIYENIEKILKSFKKKTLTQSEMQTLEHRIWMNLSTLKELPIILHSMTLIEEFEIKGFNASCRGNTTEFTSFFSIQFHRNLCRLLEDVIYNRQEYIATAGITTETEMGSSGATSASTSKPASTTSASSKNPSSSSSSSSLYVQYVRARIDLLRAYDMLIEINSQISLSSTHIPPPGTENNKWGKQNNARAEAICWAARRLVPSTTPQSPNPSLHRLPSTSAPSVTMLLRSTSRVNSDSPDLQLGGGAGGGGLNSNSAPLTVLSHHLESGPIIEKFHDTMSVSSANSSTISSPASPSIHQSSSQRTHSSSSPPPMSLHLSLDSSYTNSGNANRLVPVSTFLLFHHCLASKIFRQHSTSQDGNDDGSYPFAYDEFTILLDVNEGYLPSINQHSHEDGPLDSIQHPPVDQHLVLHFSHPKVGKEMLAFLFKSLLGDVFGLQKFSSALEIMKLGDGFALRKSLPLMMAFMEAQSMSIVFNALVNRQMSASPLQRWIRDTLLTFQGFLSGEDEDDEDQENSQQDTSFKSQLSKLLSDVIRSRPSSQSQEAPADPTVDEVVRYLLRPAWIQARKSLHLECTMIIAAQILEVLEAVSDQLERRSFGEVTLNNTKVAWETLIRQLRVVMLLSSRAGGVLSVERLGNGEISIYSLLAADTLCFAMQADQAAEHELRCQDVYSRRAAKPLADGQQQTNTDTKGSTSTSQQSDSDLAAGGALLAWGPAADARWKELVTVAEAEDAFLQEAAAASGMSSPRPPGVTSSSSKGSKSKSGNKKIRRRRPLLLFFPSHNQPGPLGAYRGMALAERWSRRPKRVEILSLAGAHLLPIPPITRAAVAQRILLTVIFPLLRAYLDVEEAKLQKVHTTDAAQEFLIVMADPELVETLVQSVIELITFCLQGTASSFASASSGSGSGGISSKQQLIPVKSSAVTSVAVPSVAVTVTECEDETYPVTWPPVNDPKLTNLMKEFQSFSNAGQGISDVSARRHMGLLWALQLRTQCSLRGVKISELFGSKLLKTMCLSDSLSPLWPHLESSHAHLSSGGAASRNRDQTLSFTSDDDFQSELEGSYSLPTAAAGSTRSPSITSSLSDDLHSSLSHVTTQQQPQPQLSLKTIREEFLLQCFRRLATQSSNIVYSVAEIWDIDNTQARLVHLTTLLELGHDDIIAELINHFEDSLMTADKITQGLRIRLGNSIAYMERIPACGSLLASLDPQAVTWVREAVGPPDRTTLDGIMKGKIKVINFDVPSTRHLVIRVQALLFGVSISSRDQKWMERKTKCDALLSLCSSLSETEVQSQLKGSGLLLVSK